MKRRLLLDSNVVEYLQNLPLKERKSIWTRLQEITKAPDRFIDYLDEGDRGRDLSVHVYQGHAIRFWDDIADRHLKILQISPADRSEGY